MKLKAIKKLAERIPSETIVRFIASQGGSIDAYFVHKSADDPVGRYYFVTPDKTVMLTMDDDAVFTYALTKYLIANGVPVFEEEAEMERHVASLKSKT
ncbi:MAG TPA: hypothetical protein VLE43_14745 [Candidatus Saccharimonadia bacterium]|nr:hypothetical protein [Candidatus Saccharimonadia bacterium]